MGNELREQRRFMEEEWKPLPWVERSTLTPMADYAHHSPLMFCRERLPPDLSGHSFLIVSAGDGVDTRYFQMEGVCRVTATDISQRALSLLREHCPGARPAVAATEQLPFADASFDFVGVRSGLHHLEEPFIGLEEMARVARLGFFFIETHHTPLVPILVRMGFLEYVEEAGNRVIRFKRQEVAEQLAQLGITDYTLDTGSFMQFWTLLKLSRRVPGRLPDKALRAFVKVFNLLFGRLGNAIILVAKKSPWHAEP